MIRQHFLHTTKVKSNETTNIINYLLGLDGGSVVVRRVLCVIIKKECAININEWRKVKLFLKKKKIK